MPNFDEQILLRNVMKLKLAGLSVAAAVLLSYGCASVSYQGETLPPSTAVKVLKNQGQTTGYRQLGTAVISGSYTDYSYEELMQKLSKKAKSVGADAIYVAEYEVMPVDMVRDDQLLNMTSKSFNLVNDRSGQDLSILDNQINDHYSRIGATSVRDPKTYTYKRVIKALFLKKK